MLLLAKNIVLVVMVQQALNYKLLELNSATNFIKISLNIGDI